MFEFASAYNKLVRSVQFCDIWNTFYHVQNSKSWNVQVHSVHTLVDDEGHKSTVSIVVASCTPMLLTAFIYPFSIWYGEFVSLGSSRYAQDLCCTKKATRRILLPFNTANGAVWGCRFPPKMVPNSNAALSVQSGIRPDFLYSLPYEDTKGGLFCSSNIQYEHTI